MRNVLVNFLMFSITVCSYSQQDSNSLEHILLQQNSMETAVFAKNVLVNNSFNTSTLLSHSFSNLHLFMSTILDFSEEISDDNENFISIEEVTSFLSSKNFIYILSICKIFR